MGDVIPFRKYDANAAPVVSDYWGPESFDLLALLEAIDKANNQNKTNS